MGRLTENRHIISLKPSVYWKHKTSSFGYTTDTSLKVITLPDMTPYLLVWFYWPSGENSIFFQFSMVHHYITNGIHDVMSSVSFHSYKNGSLKAHLLTKLFQEAEDSERVIFGIDTEGVIDLVQWKLFGRKRVLPVWICYADTHSCIYVYTITFNLSRWHSIRYTFIFNNIQFVMLTLNQVHIYIQ